MKKLTRMEKVVRIRKAVMLARKEYGFKLPKNFIDVYVLLSNNQDTTIANKYTHVQLDEIIQKLREGIEHEIAKQSLRDQLSKGGN